MLCKSPPSLSLGVAGYVRWGEGVAGYERRDEGGVGGEAGAHPSQSSWSHFAERWTTDVIQHSMEGTSTPCIA